MTGRSNRNKTQSKVPTEDLQKEYRAIVSSAGLFCDELVHQLRRILTQNDITLAVPLQHRVKTWDSIAEKMDRIAPNIKHILELQDLAGVRLILLFQRDAAKVGELIGESFNVIRSYDTGSRLNEDQFGYQSTHYVVGIPDSWQVVPTLANTGGLVAEIQVRTAAQHVWSEVSRILQYKNEQSTPKSMLRAIYRTSALLELVDLEFERLLVERDDYRRVIEGPNSLAESPLDVDVVRQVLAAMFPEPNTDPEDHYAGLVMDLFAFHIFNGQALMDLISKHYEEVIASDKEMVSKVLSDPEFYMERDGDALKRARAGAYFSHVGLTRTALVKHAGADRWSKYLASKYESQAKND